MSCPRDEAGLLGVRERRWIAARIERFQSVAEVGVAMQAKGAHFAIGKIETTIS